MNDYHNSLTFEYVGTKLLYELDTGKFFWRVDAARNIKAGAEAGCVKATRTSRRSGETVSYRYIRIDGFNIPAAQVAWLLGTGSWPKGRLSFSDRNPLNLAISNLEQSNFLETKYDHSVGPERNEYLREHRKKYPLEWKNIQLKSTFGISLEEYVKLALAQGGNCAICKQPETQMRGGKIKMLAVDHCHTTGKVRGLLCTDCNQAIGKLKENKSVFESAVSYLEAHKKEPEAT